MKCFYIFKDKSKKKKGDSRSAPELRNRSGPDTSPLNRTSRSLPSPRSITELYKEKEHNLRAFSFEELREATHGFSRLLKIGEGGFGSVYKGTIRPVDGQGESLLVAIKKLNKYGLQGHKQWLAEVQFLGVVNHPNLVKLLGYCSVDNERGIQRLLVYEYMPNKSLEDHLFSRALPTLPWKTRLEIMLGAAEGLAYLHGGLEVQVIYRDFKSSNVLLDQNFKPKLSDFGLAREGPTEYVETGHLTSHSDIWSFGVVLYEILTGRRTLERNRPTSEQKLLDWVKQFPADSKKFSMIMDPRLRNDYSIAAAKRVAKLADNCLNKNSKERPFMTEVVGTLKLAIQDSEGTSTSSSIPSQSRLAERKANRV
ncbi:Protein kinase APK1B, chloroplast precursor, putative [Ricinus communis]|uniref:non-specific serine/threonine protein kinase n=1 Tax=Ricinus communis TaxID=3988 RepID=B9RUR6_RICCO|nr:Protein kinase APK1B, chloroplast precursor, putative [Ricinus communis]